MSTGPRRDLADDAGAQLLGLMLTIVLLMALVTITFLPFGRAADLRAEAVSAADAAALAAAVDLREQWQQLVVEAEQDALRRAARERERREEARLAAEEAGEDPELLPDPADVQVRVLPVDLGRLDGGRAEVAAAAWAEANDASLVAFVFEGLEVEVETRSDGVLRVGVPSPTPSRAVARARTFLDDAPVLLPTEVLDGPAACVPRDTDDEDDDAPPACPPDDDGSDGDGSDDDQDDDGSDEA